MKKILFAFRYILYRIKAVDEHGVHSPFVYELLTNVIYVKAEYYSFKQIEKLREQLLDSNKTISLVDLGACGNKELFVNKKIKNIAKQSAKPTKYAQLLFRLVNYFQPSHILELGTSLGISTAYLASTNTKARVTTIEGSKELAEIAMQNFKQLQLNNIEQVIGNFDDVLEDVVNKFPTIDFVFFDGNHRKQATIDYFELCLKKANENSVFVFDDINWSDDMLAAWNEIKENDKVTISIDLFFMGLVFFKPGRAKQHFVIQF